MVVDFLSLNFGFSFKPFSFGFYGEKVHKGKTVLFVKPSTYMNRSGDAVLYVLNERGEKDTSKVLVVHDDMDLPLGSAKLRWNGGDGGHRGIRSIVGSLGTPNFYRLKIGIGRPPSGVMASDYVLSEFLPEERERFERVLRKSARLFDLVIEHGPSKGWSLFRMEEVDHGED